MYFQRIDSEDLRKVPIGVDAKGGYYWYFYGTRLYREQPPNIMTDTQTVAYVHVVTC